MRTSEKTTAQDQAALQRLSACLAQSPDNQTMAVALSELLSKAELRGLSRRWQLLELLHQGISQREIAARLGLSLGTVSRGSHELKRPETVIRKMLSSLFPLAAADHKLENGDSGQTQSPGEKL